ncbi:hypothetical protein ABS768_04135 [Flavobacterium sp. ST-75]|uniref:DUF2938 domain-containing protein n=1 Tax=Flavobacterium rhizophilum TaxID=3163296 RepID=A0ABW8YBU3_9FLAO
MKAVGKIIIAGIAGTTLMTLYSYYRAKKEHQEYIEPVVMNKLIDNSQALPEIDNTYTHPAGWALHYAAGIFFIGGYYLLWQNTLNRPTTHKILFMGSFSGLIGILIWKTLFSSHDNPPYNNRMGYYRQLLIAHIVFTVTGVSTYKLLNNA